MVARALEPGRALCADDRGACDLRQVGGPRARHRPRRRRAPSLRATPLPVTPGLTRGPPSFAASRETSAWRSNSASAIRPVAPLARRLRLARSAPPRRNHFPTACQSWHNPRSTDVMESGSRNARAGLQGFSQKPPFSAIGGSETRMSA